MKNPILLTAAIAAISFANLGSASATLLTYEGYNYTASANITSQTGGSGWRTPQASFPWGTGGTTGTVATSGLTYTGINAAYTVFAPTGLAGNYGGAFRNQRLLAIDAGGVYDTASLRGAGNFIGGSTVTGTLWGSFLVGASLWDTASGPQMIFNLGTTAGTGTQAGLRQISAGSAISLTDQNGGTIGATGTIATSALSTTNPNLIVFRMAFNGASDDTMSVWLNPTAASDTASITATQANFVLNNPEWRSVNANGSLVFDEIRFGTTFADVVPIPEPSTYVLLLGGIGVLLILRRCRRA
ncbi:MAG: PEP-CTERM sorting domain-containing protein [Blastochloris sp.]|nr:PEP-CTERM sorting domain-containing protein [Blastochloris sp.]